jgi:hypothetical protein
VQRLVAAAGTDGGIAGRGVEANDDQRGATSRL